MPASVMKPSIQKLRRIPAALSDSLSSEVGQKASAPSLLESLFTGAPIFSNHDLLLALVFPQVDAGEDACCDDILEADRVDRWLRDCVAVGGAAIGRNEPHHLTSGYGGCTEIMSFWRPLAPILNNRIIAARFAVSRVVCSTATVNVGKHEVQGLVEDICMRLSRAERVCPSQF